MKGRGVIRAGSIAALLILLSASSGLPADAATHTCNNQFCSGSDGSTRYNTQGNNPRIYIGEVGLYGVDFGSDSGPCPNWVYGACFNMAAADGAETVYYNGNGLGVDFYYFGGGSFSQYAAQWGSPYCWGWHQGIKAVAHAANSFSSYYNTAFLMVLDIEQGQTYGWDFTGSGQANRDVFSGFRDYVQEADSQDQAHCSSKNTTLKYQHAVYSGPDWWNGSMGSYNSLSRTPEWTNDDCCQATYPGDFTYSSSFKARWYGGTTNADNHDIWQFDDASHPDYDIAHEPLCFPIFGGYCLGT